MKKSAIIFLLLLCCFGIAYVWNKPNDTKSDTIYLNANDDVSFKRLQKLSKALNNEGYRTVLSTKESFQSGLLNIYAVNTDQIAPLPTVLDSKAINFLWMPTVIENMPEPLRAYDVIIVENMPSFAHLKAVNVRTAYIPEAIDIKENTTKAPEYKAMYYGNKDKFSLALYLAGVANMSLDIFGQGFGKEADKHKFIREKPHKKDFINYAITLIDQSDEEIAQELINDKIIEVLEQGGLPYVRYNNGIAKIFGAALPMYRNEQEFLPKAQLFIDNPTFAANRRQELYNVVQQWNSQSQAKKFSELFEIMKKKLKRQ